MEEIEAKPKADSARELELETADKRLPDQAGGAKPTLTLWQQWQFPTLIALTGCTICIIVIVLLPAIPPLLSSCLGALGIGLILGAPIGQIGQEMLRFGKICPAVLLFSASIVSAQFAFQLAMTINGALVRGGAIIVSVISCITAFSIVLRRQVVTKKNNDQSSRGQANE